MLSSSTSATPRPRPPAKARRDANNQSSPPPPYGAFTFPSSPDRPTPSRAPAGKMPRHTPSPSMEGVPEDWMSRHGLSEIVQKVNGLVKERENGTSVARLHVSGLRQFEQTSH